MAKEMRIEGSHVAPVVKALSNDVRLKILSLLSDADMNVQNIAAQLDLSKTAVLTHINLLEQAGFIRSEYRTGTVGNQRICHKVYDRLIFDFDPQQKSDADDEMYYETEVPVGNFFGFDAWAPCGLASHGHIIRKWDDPSSFCDVERVNAALVWTAFGYLEYRIPVDPLFIGKRITKVKIVLEISPHHMVRTHKALCLPPDIPISRITEDVSDVTIWVNGAEVGTQTVTIGDDREGAIYTPAWWRTLPYNGELLKISLNDSGCLPSGRVRARADGLRLARTGARRRRCALSRYSARVRTRRVYRSSLLSMEQSRPRRDARMDAALHPLPHALRYTRDTTLGFVPTSVPIFHKRKINLSLR